VCLIDGRDLFKDVIGEGGLKYAINIYQLIQMLPEFILEMYAIRDDTFTIGKFHLG